MIGTGEIVTIAVVAALLFVFLPLLALVPLVGAWLRRIRASAEAEAREAGPTRLLDPGALGVGVTSRGPTQLRGTGCLAATDRELVFVQWVPRRTLRIPRASIVGVTRVDSHLGKRMGTPFLHVTWGEPGATDSAAWRVADLVAWERELRGGSDGRVTDA